MARARQIKPGFFKNEELSELPFSARLLFVGLWTLADREGILENRPRRIKAEIFPYDGVRIEELIDDLAAHGFIVCYEVDGDKYIAIPTFNKHQNPHVSEKKSTYPKPEEHSASIPKNGTNRASSLTPSTLTPSSPTPDPLPPDLPPKPGVRSVAIARAPDERALRTLDECAELYKRAGLPIAEKHRQLALQKLISLDPSKLPRIPNFIKWALATGRWPDPSKTKAFLPMLTDGDWDVELTERTLPPPPGQQSRGEAAHAEAERRFKARHGGGP